MRKETMIVCPFAKGGYAVRPMDWTGIYDKNGRLDATFRVTALFEEESDAEEYCKIYNDPLKFIMESFSENECLRKTFLMCLENALKECNLPFTSDSDIAKATLGKLTGVGKGEG